MTQAARPRHGNRLFHCLLLALAAAALMTMLGVLLLTETIAVGTDAALLGIAAKVAAYADLATLRAVVLPEFLMYLAVACAAALGGQALARRRASSTGLAVASSRGDSSAMAALRSLAVALPIAVVATVVGVGLLADIRLSGPDGRPLDAPARLQVFSDSAALRGQVLAPFLVFLGFAFATALGGQALARRG